LLNHYLCAQNVRIDIDNDTDPIEDLLAPDENAPVSLDTPLMEPDTTTGALENTSVFHEETTNVPSAPNSPRSTVHDRPPREAIRRDMPDLSTLSSNTFRTIRLPQHVRAKHNYTCTMQMIPSVAPPNSPDVTEEPHWVQSGAGTQRRVRY